MDRLCFLNLGNRWAYSFGSPPKRELRLLPLAATETEAQEAVYRRNQAFPEDKAILIDLNSSKFFLKG